MCRKPSQVYHVIPTDFWVDPAWRFVRRDLVHSNEAQRQHLCKGRGDARYNPLGNRHEKKIYLCMIRSGKWEVCVQPFL